MNKSELKRRYEKLVLEVKTKPYYTEVRLDGKLQVYMCPFGHITAMKVIDAGVTPMFYKCDHCTRMGSSIKFVPTEEPSQEWYRPSLDELMKLKEPAMVEHVLMGGLMVRKIKS